MARPRAALHGSTLSAIGIAVLACGCSLGLGGQSWTVQLGDPAMEDAAAEGGPDAAAGSAGPANVSPEAADDLDASSSADDAGGGTGMPAGPGGGGAPGSAGSAPPPAGMQDASTSEDAGQDPSCAKLSTCCPVLVFLSASLLSSCDSTVATNTAASCESFISGFNSFGLCM